jgi:tetratricopeptide (TPR) repeat protein
MHKSWLRFLILLIVAISISGCATTGLDSSWARRKSHSEYRIGRDLMKTREAYLAGDHLNAAVALGPDNPTFRFARGYYYFLMGAENLARLDFSKLLDSDPTNPYYHVHLAKTLGSGWRERESKLSHYSTAITIGHEDVPAFYVWRAETYVSMQQLYHALQDYDEALALLADDQDWSAPRYWGLPDRTEVYLSAADLMFRMGDIDRALAVIGTAADEDLLSVDWPLPSELPYSERDIGGGLVARVYSYGALSQYYGFTPDEPIQIDQPMPDFEFSTSDGHTVSSRALAGSVYVLYAWRPEAYPVRWNTITGECTYHELEIQDDHLVLEPLLIMSADKDVPLVLLSFPWPAVSSPQYAYFDLALSHLRETTRLVTRPWPVLAEPADPPEWLQALHQRPRIVLVDQDGMIRLALDSRDPREIEKTIEETMIGLGLWPSSDGHEEVALSAPR